MQLSAFGTLCAALCVVLAFSLVGTAATTHVVRRGETLSQVARRYGTTVGAIARANGITNIHRVLAGQSLLVEDGPGATLQQIALIAPAAGDPAGSVAPSAGDDPAAYAVHVVSPGETLTSIAKATGTTVTRLGALNSIANIDRLRVGIQLKVPAPTPDPPASLLDQSRIPAQLRGSPERQALAPLFERWSAECGVPADLVMGLSWVESGWQNEVISSAGAAGIGQIMPNTAIWLSQNVIKAPLDVRNPEHNIRMTACYLRWLLDRTGGDVPTAVAGYYQGLNSVRTVGVYPVSQTYLSAVMGATERFF